MQKVASLPTCSYAQPRMTRAIDLVIEIQNNDVIKLAQQLGDTYYFDEDMAHTAIAQESMFNILHQDSMIKIDCIVRKNHSYCQQEFLRRQCVTFPRSQVPLHCH